ncbi:nuclear transport factor 2 family protein [Microbulbifer epialgicus]|uniref:Nuclear transport factor 2 family protein n=1 Tax=Microbulbifer epialgicus TaxID=393907 RepID=A0ABV4P1P0_9GAMM
MNELQLFKDRFAISDLLARYTLAVDNHDTHGWASLFTPDGRFINGNRMIKGRKKLERYAVVHSKIGSRHITCSPLHYISEDGQSASGKASTVVIIATRSGYRVAMAAEYRNELVKVDGNWLFESRRADEFGLPEDPKFPILNADPDTRDLLNLLLDAWNDLGEPLPK